MTAPLPISSLPDQVADVSSAIVRGGYLVTRRSAPNWLVTGDIPYAAYLANIRVGLKIFFATQTSSSILFFFHVDGQTYIPIEAAIQFRILPATEPPPMVSGAVPRRSVLPSFVLSGLSQSDVTALGPTGATAQNTVFLSLLNGANVLAVANANDGKRAALRYSPNRVPGPEQTPRTGYSLLPFLDLMRTLRDWLDDDMPTGAALPAVGSSQPNAMTQILDALTSAYVNAVAQLATPTGPLADAPDWFHKYCRLEGFAASMRLRLKQDGSLSEKPSQESMDIAASITIMGANPRSTLTLGDPGFVAVGILRETYLNELALDPACTKQLAKLLDIFDTQVGYYIDSARSDAIVIRIREDDADRAVIWLPGKVGSDARPLLLSGVFIVKGGPTPTVVVNEDIDLVNLTDKLDREDAGPFFALVNTIRLWIGFL